MKKTKGEVKVSFTGNPFKKNETSWNFGVHNVKVLNADIGLKQIMELLKRLGKG
ncbi:hypothetical protein N8Z09_04090 [Methylophilaceae bacterium]|nr:hypothetical protein [Methylophilaceae bacterium]